MDAAGTPLYSVASMTGLAASQRTPVVYVSDPAKPVPYVRRPVRWDDPDLAIDWPITDERLAMSRKDRANPSLEDHWRSSST